MTETLDNTRRDFLNSIAGVVGYTAFANMSPNMLLLEQEGFLPIDYDYNSSEKDLDQIISDLKSYTDEYWTRLMQFKNPTPEYLEQAHKQLYTNILVGIIHSSIKKGIPEFVSLGEKAKKTKEFRDVDIHQTLHDYFNHYDYTFVLGQNLTIFPNKQASLAMVILGRNKKKEAKMQVLNEKVVYFNEIVLEETIITPIFNKFNRFPALAYKNNIIISEDIIKERGRMIFDIAAGNLIYKNSYSKSLDRVLSDTRYKLLMKEWSDLSRKLIDENGMQNAKEYFASAYAENIIPSLRVHELSHITSSRKTELDKEVEAFYNAFACSEHPYGELARTIDSVLLRSDQHYFETGKWVLSTFVAVMMNSTQQFKNIDYSKVTGLDETSSAHLISQFAKLSKDQIKYLAQTAMNDNLYPSLSTGPKKVAN